MAEAENDVRPALKEVVERVSRFTSGEMCAVIYASRDAPEGGFLADLRTILATLSAQAATLEAMASSLEPLVDEFGCTIEQYHKLGPHWTSVDGEMFDVAAVMDREPLIEAARTALSQYRKTGDL